jgi:hypothetical protein
MSMDRIVMDSKSLEKLRGLQQSVEVFDHYGTRLGTFQPDLEAPRLGFTDAEIDAAFARVDSGEKGRTWEEIKADLLRMKR